MTVRTRIAPSPTGDPHVGTAFVALINYCFAKRHGGQFLLRIEDTDRARSTPESERAILDALHWLGLDWDEGPDVGGPHGPYRQSERLAYYKRYADELLAAGHAFKCFCTPERLEALRVEQRSRSLPPGYDGLCLTLTPAEVAASEAAGISHVVRLRVPRDGSVTIDDLLRGEIVFEWRTVDMQILVKSDGWPTYHLANVVDDHLMGITHVMRGEEWLSSAPKHALLYRYFDWPMPQLCHLPLLRNADKSKLSKRKNPTGILFYKAMGYLPEALLNFLGLLAVPPLDGEEMMGLKTMVEHFGLEHISTGGPVFDVTKLDWLNGRYLREKLDDATFAERVRAWALNPSYLEKIAPLARSRIERLSDLGPLLAFFFAGRLDVDPARLREGKLDEESLRKAFVLASTLFDALEDWDVGGIEQIVRRIADVLGAKLRDVVRPYYVAITGSAQSVPLFDSMQILGRDLVRERLRGALEKLGGASAKEQEAWKKLLTAKPEVPA
jgi:glutamyl-tRNA synthetase